ncbi:MAG: hypothetical protein H6694_07835 [Candidatus Latescibacteria bacterium]|nr:hypothetical protein [bacterium]MCB9514205.1 hypothetical protein [Candidatus Latescibacterota bacterium]
MLALVEVRTMMWNRRIAGAILCLLAAVPMASASLEFYPLSDTPLDCHSTRIAGGARVVAAWVQGESGVFSRTWTEDGLQPLVDHGVGTWPDVADAEGGFVLAWEREDIIHLKSGDGLSWSDMEVYDLGVPLRFPRLTGYDVSQWVHGFYLCFQGVDGTVYFAERDQGVWQPAIPVFTGLTPYGTLFAQAVAVPDGGGVQPRVYAVDEDELLYTQRTSTGWTAPVAVHPGLNFYGVEFAVASGADGSQHLLSNGPQPTCPCNVLTYTSCTPAGEWSWPLQMSVEIDNFTWPQDPAIAVDTAGRVHASWFQQHYGLNMQPTWKALYYEVLDGGVWTDHGEPFCCQRGEDVDMDLRQGIAPALVWTQDWDGPFEVWMAVDRTISATEGAPAARAQLTAQPNPFNPKVTLRFSLPAPGEARLAIVDAAGRQLRTLLDGRLPAGEQVLDWDGRDDTGRPLASGVYLASLRSADGSSATKLVLLR